MNIIPVRRYDFDPDMLDESVEFQTSFRSHAEVTNTLANYGAGQAVSWIGHAGTLPNASLFQMLYAKKLTSTMLVSNTRFDGGAIVTDYAFQGICFPMAMISVGIVHQDNTNLSSIAHYDHIKGSWSLWDSVAEYGEASLHLMKLQIDIQAGLDSTNLPAYVLTVTVAEDGVEVHTDRKRFYIGRHFIGGCAPIIITVDVNATISTEWMVHAVQPSHVGTGMLESIL